MAQETQANLDLDALLEEALSESANESANETSQNGAEEAPRVESASRSSYSTKAESGA